MKITKRQLRRIIKEWTKEEQGHAKDLLRQHGSQIEFEWDRSGLAMGMYVNRQLVMEFSRQKQVEELIQQLQDLLEGPMRTSP